MPIPGRALRRLIPLAPVALSMMLAATSAPAQEAGGFEAARAQYLAGDYDAALEVLRPLAEAGDPAAQNILGDAYDTGRGVARDGEEARAWFDRAAVQGYVLAQVNLAGFWRRGDEDTPPDPERARDYYEQAMAAGYGEAFTQLGLMYTEGAFEEAGAGEGTGDGDAHNHGTISHDPEAAIALYRQGLEHGSAEAATLLADHYRLGDGVPEDMAEARRLYGEAARMGDPLGMNNLGAMYENGLGGPEDVSAAYALYRLAFEAGSARGANNVAWLTVGESGFWSDPVTGYAFCLRSMAMADPVELSEFQPGCAAMAEGLDEAARAEAEALADTL